MLAAGGVQLEATAASRRWRYAAGIAAAARVVQTVLALPITIPQVPQSSLVRFGLDSVRKDDADTVGWPELVSQVAGVHRQHPPAEQQRTAILASKYGEAGAIDRYGQALGLPAALSPNLTFWYWKPAHVAAQTAIAIGFDEPDMRRLRAEVRVAETVQSVDGVRTEAVGRLIQGSAFPIGSSTHAWSNRRREADPNGCTRPR